MHIPSRLDAGRIFIQLFKRISAKKNKFIKNALNILSYSYHFLFFFS